ncbi:hypothetical protein E2C01_041654 [Portunus trituberculatus]|uniref:Uncharacterized protein n=1 Tax=Portunus trituberculatus TaxID=210409 RepID=A0A5B7FSA4_PORTR|nr:hypothetical protein [Portunus trituberculatus]
MLRYRSCYGVFTEATWIYSVCPLPYIQTPYNEC